MRRLIYFESNRQNQRLFKPTEKAVASIDNASYFKLAVHYTKEASIMMSKVPSKNKGECTVVKVQAEGLQVKPSFKAFAKICYLLSNRNAAITKVKP